MFKTNEEIRLNLWNLKIKPLDLKNKVHKQQVTFSGPGWGGEEEGGDYITFTAN